MYGALDVRLFPNKRLNVDLKNIEIWVSHGLNNNYVNYRHHFVNICAHNNDFDIEVGSYNFFATNHGKTLVMVLVQLSKEK